MSISQDKAAARKQASDIRANAHENLHTVAKENLSLGGLNFLVPETNLQVAQKSVSGFIPYRSEIDVTAMMAELLKQGYITCLPIVTGKNQPLTFRQWQPGDKTQKGVWNIPVPLLTAPTIEPDILLVPLLAFDRRGFRLGYGGGFYDRTIEKLKQTKSTKSIVTIGVAYSAQEVTNVPKDNHDQQLDWILTEKGPIKCG